MGMQSQERLNSDSIGSLIPEKGNLKSQMLKGKGKNRERWHQLSPDEVATRLLDQFGAQSSQSFRRRVMSLDPEQRQRYDEWFAQSCRRIRIGQKVVESRQKRQALIAAAATEAQAAAAQTFIFPPEIPAADPPKPPHFLSKLKEKLINLGSNWGHPADWSDNHPWVTGAVSVSAALGLVAIFLLASQPTPSPSSTYRYNPEQFKVAQIQPKSNFFRSNMGEVKVVEPETAVDTSEDLATDRVTIKVSVLDPDGFKIASVARMVASDKDERTANSTTSSQEDRYEQIVVQSGDTLSQIALTFYGDASKAQYERIAKANPDLIKDPDKIQAGWKIKVPLDKTAFIG
jgi:nucleoid-associated protein YgaU